LKRRLGTDNDESGRIVWYSGRGRCLPLRSRLRDLRRILIAIFHFAWGSIQRDDSQGFQDFPIGSTMTTQISGESNRSLLRKNYMPSMPGRALSGLSAVGAAC